MIDMFHRICIMSWVVLFRTPRVLFSFFRGFYLRDFAVHSDGVSPHRCRALYCIVYSGLYFLSCIIIILFIL